MTLSDVSAQSKRVVCRPGEARRGLRSKAWGMTANIKRRTTKPDKMRMTGLLLLLSELMAKPISFRDGRYTLSCQYEYYKHVCSKSMLFIWDSFLLNVTGRFHRYKSL